ncbi:ROK family transcriptional regulator [Salegentibacter salinarum]|uniref:ROK family transcriptional regulator n=1 Tax=Salegentibacter salinarum TaxID=447422 RepID=A0A2N0U068_9FLAO|nr:class I mannose-6-phosphate isomerase [Salegentibacter salinarum]PKD20403.1 ROK family transcriptional regulator [Salegentibacter salinarum]SKB85163.1 Mannose-6-phosphate isomerase, class I [Salegentibacter salinarum]
MNQIKSKVRETSQLELPLKKNKSISEYDIYPAHHIGDNLIQDSYESLAKELASFDYLKIDGYVGILFEEVREKLNEAFGKIGIKSEWVNIQEALKEEREIESLVAPFLGGDDPVFGKIAAIELKDFFDLKKMSSLVKPKSSNPVIFYGTGAHLIPVEGKTIYFDISKNEIQFRSRAGSITNIGTPEPGAAKTMYKRFYFVDWVVLNKHKNQIKNEISYLVDGQRTDDISWVKGDVWRESIIELTKRPVRVRPWFEPGAWGGQWIKNKIKGLPQDVVNYAWSFELIVPENGIIIESSGVLLEYSFDFLMFVAGEEILGKDFESYQYDFPIRFNFLDTFDGGNLSVQCHPQKEYVKNNFGENFTQEETYYILDKKNNAQVYLGFQDGVTPDNFREALQSSQEENKEMDILRYVRSFDSEKHGLYLIPPGTIHSSGKDNLVLEISSTKYLYTFKMYDWLRVDIDGKPRPINIERGMENLVFERSGDRVEKELISKPKVIESNADMELQHLPTHKEHLYDIHRFKINTSVTVKTDGQAHVLSLVEGEKIELSTKDSTSTFHYAESFVIPAAAEEYTIKNLAKNPVMVVKAFVK